MPRKNLMKRYCDHPLEIFKDKDLAKGYVCFLCNQIIFNAFTDKCNHTFCQHCILKQVRENGCCPISKENLTLGDIKLSLLYINIIENLEVICIHASEGCSWEGKCKNLDLHFKKDCMFSQVTCKFKGCNFVGQKRKMNFHFLKCRFRQMKCKYCKKIMPYEELTKHSKKCKNQEMECFLGCGKIINRRKKKEHEINDCPFFKVNCEYKQFGCTFVCKRSNMNSHLESEDSYFFHVHLIEKKLEHIENLKNIKKNSKNNYVKLLSKQDGSEFHNNSEMEKRSIKTINSSLKSIIEKTDFSDTDSIKVDIDKQSMKSLNLKGSE